MFFHVIIRDPHFWRTILAIGLCGQLMILPEFLQGYFGTLGSLAMIGCAFYTLRYFNFAYHCVEQLPFAAVPNRRIWVSGSVEHSNSSGTARMYAGDVEALLERAGAIPVGRRDDAEVLIRLEGDIPLISFEDATGYRGSASLHDLDSRSIVRHLGEFIWRSDAHRTNIRVGLLDWRDPQVRRVILAIALIAQLFLGWARGIFVFQHPHRVGVLEYVLTAGGCSLTSYLLFKAQLTCRSLVPNIRGRKLFVTGSGYNLNEAEIDAPNFVAELAAQGAVLVSDPDDAEFRVVLGELTTEITRGRTQHVVVTDETHIASGLRKMLKQL